MSTSLLYHGFGIRGYQYIRTCYEKGAVIFKARQDPGDLCCSNCGSRKVIRRGKVWRRFRSIPIGLKPVLILMPIQRVFCLFCGVIRQVKIGFADHRRSYTKAFERYALELSKCMTIQDVARHLGVSWGMVKEIQKRNLFKRFHRPRLKDLKRIAIDEISIGKHHQYLTIVLDLDTGAVVFVGDGKGTEALLAFWRRLKASRARIEAVAMDMSPAYISAVFEHLPEAQIVFDHFHIIKLYNEKLSQLRRDLLREAVDIRQKQILKGTRWLLLKNSENLNTQKDEQERLHQALELNLPLTTAYYMKEELRQLWKQPDTGGVPQ